MLLLQYYDKEMFSMMYKYIQYKYDKPIGHILIEMTETTKSYKIKLIENLQQKREGARMTCM